ncbi:AI-2E family transporter [Nitrospira sp. CMX1]|nr:AI-2E family transporter [Nitrospira sp.]
MSNEPTQSTTAQLWVAITTTALWVGMAYLLFVTFRPFLSGLLWSAVLSYSLYPQYRRITTLSGNRRSLSALIMSVTVTVGVILPLAYLSFLIGKEVAQSYLTIVSALDQGPNMIEQWRVHPWVTMMSEQLQEFERMTGSNLRSMLIDNLAQLGTALVEQLTRVAKNVFAGLLELGIILLCTFYFFRDGQHIVHWLKDVLPFEAHLQQLVARRFGEVVQGAVLGNTLVAALEGLVGGFAFWLAGIPGPLLWGAVMGILAYLPLVGAGIVWLPIALYSFIQGDFSAGAILCFSGFLIAVLDYVVRTVVVGETSKLHTLLTFFSVLGGIQFFGVVGIVTGPLVVAISFAILESYRTERTGTIPHNPSP